MIECACGSKNVQLRFDREDSIALWCCQDCMSDFADGELMAINKRLKVLFRMVETREQHIERLRRELATPPLHEDC